MTWTKLLDWVGEDLTRGYILKYSYYDIYTNKMEYRLAMLCETPLTDGYLLSLIRLDGHNGGHIFQNLPKESIASEEGLTKNWLLENWNHWICEETDINDVWVREPLNADALDFDLKR